MASSEFFCGIDCGAAATKVVIIDQSQKVAAFAITTSGIDFQHAAEVAFAQAKRELPDGSKVQVIVATGYGRGNVGFAATAKTEIACHAKAAYHHYPQPITVVDIGSQDNKIIHLDAKGRMLNFKMNRKCAAGTGAFLEEISAQLGVSLAQMNQLALKAEADIALNSFCTVFAKTEILGLIRQGQSLENIVRAVYGSVAKRIIEMDPLGGTVVMTGGVAAHNSAVIALLEQKLGKKILLPPQPQLAGAYGAALFALATG